MSSIKMLVSGKNIYLVEKGASKEYYTVKKKKLKTYHPRKLQSRSGRVIAWYRSYGDKNYRLTETILFLS